MACPCTLRASIGARCGAALAACPGKPCGKAGRAIAPLLAALAALLCCNTARADDAERGRRLLAQYQCGSCHVIPGVAGASGRSAPPLEAFGKRSYIAGQAPNQRDALVRWIIAPTSLVPGATMPAMGAGPADARDMAAYLLHLR
jgi:cytochrome c2